MLKIVHVVPYDGIGGVEVAARTIDDGDYHELRFLKYYLSHKAAPRPVDASRPVTYVSENDPRAYFSAVCRLWALKPEMLLASLWRSCFVLLVIKLLRPKTKAVTFLHYANDVHWIDKILTRMAMRASTEIWADSQATLDTRVPRPLLGRAKVISFVTQRIPATPVHAPAPTFAFWGRLHPQKGLVRALHLFSRVVATHPSAIFHVIGPDGGDRTAIDGEVAQLGLAASVHFHGPMEREAIFNFVGHCTFYLQTSVDEGMAISVIEAMQLGLVPVVTPVGEISRYAQDGENAILVRDDNKALDDILCLLEDPTNYRKIRSKAIASWGDTPLYRDSVLQACNTLLANQTKRPLG